MFVIIKLKGSDIMKSAYIHIPFCDNICAYCDFCKMKYNKEWIDTYLDSLRNELENYYKG